MRSHTLRYVALVLLLVTGAACSSDNDPVIPTDDPGLGYEDLQDRDDVFVNIEKLFNNQSLEQLVRVLDQDFIYHFSQADIVNGHVDQPSMDLTEMLGAAGNMFGASPPAVAANAVAKIQATEESTWGAVMAFWMDHDVPASKISVLVGFDEDDWSLVPDTGDKVIYEKVATYVMNVQMGETTFVTGTPIHTRIRACYSEFGGDSAWRIVEWFDDV